MTENDSESLVLFQDLKLVSRGSAREVALQAKRLQETNSESPLSIFVDRTGTRVDLDLSGSEPEVLEKLSHHPVLGNIQPKRGRGRPKLGVVSREVSLLPRHWEWLNSQQGGASATLRRLVDGARKNAPEAEKRKRAIEAAHRFLWDLGGNLPHFEEMSRALFAADFERVRSLIKDWPPGVVEQTNRYLLAASSATVENG